MLMISNWNWPTPQGNNEEEEEEEEEEAFMLLDRCLVIVFRPEPFPAGGRETLLVIMMTSRASTLKQIEWHALNPSCIG